MNIRVTIQAAAIAAMSFLTLSAFAQAAPTVKQCMGANTPVGTARGIHPGRVAWTHAPGAALWDRSDNLWYDDRYNDQEKCDWLLRNNLTSLTGEKTPAKAWKEIFRHYNRTNGKGNKGYAKGQKIAVKINNNNTYSHDDSPEIDASPHMVLALLKSLVEDAGVPQSDITIAEPSRFLTNSLFKKLHDAYPDVKYVDHVGGDGRIMAEFVPGAMHYSKNNGKLAVGIARPFTDADYVINMALLKGHVGQGVTLCGKNWYGCMSIDPDWRKNFHDNFDQNRDGNPKYMTFVDFMGHKDLGGKTILWLIDGLYGSNSVDGKPQGDWTNAPFDGQWPSSLLGSLDPVAVDMVANDILINQFPQMPDVNYSDMYLMEAAMADKAPSGTAYDPNGSGKPIRSLGVAEHWNNPKDRKYSRNLKTGRGIELVYKKK